jgi:hypothetical protein
MNPRYIIEIKVREVDANGVIRDTYGEYATTLAIEDLQEADYVAHTLRWDTNTKFAARHDSSPVAGEDGDE